MGRLSEGSERFHHLFEFCGYFGIRVEVWLLNHLVEFGADQRKPARKLFRSDSSHKAIGVLCRAGIFRSPKVSTILTQWRASAGVRWHLSRRMPGLLTTEAVGGGSTKALNALAKNHRGQAEYLEEVSRERWRQSL
jgi:hypothetical protein